MTDSVGAISDRLIEMAWEDRTPFEAIEYQFGYNEGQVIRIMREALSKSGFRRWRKRVNGRKTKHVQLRSPGTTRHKSAMQRAISRNKISKK